MVKKITGTTASRGTTAASAVKGTEQVEQTKQVSGVDQVGTVKARQGIARTRAATRPMTQEEREHLMQLVDEEAEKMLANANIPEARKRTITESVKMTLSAGWLTKAEEEG